MIIQEQDLEKTNKNKIGRPKVLNQKLKDQILLLQLQGLGVRKISNATGISKSSVHRFLREGREVNRLKSDENTITGGVVLAETKSSGEPPTLPDYKVFNIPHSVEITDKKLEEVKAELGYPNIIYVELNAKHQKKCHCHICIRIRKINWLKLKAWADNKFNNNIQ